MASETMMSDSFMPYSCRENFSAAPIAGRWRPSMCGKSGTAGTDKSLSVLRPDR
jgi:hypothetical protein